ncbi:MAG: AraC family ligand binding domain-containing protein, partial [Alicyclobacillus sp.]|nr:AraC family ligand binding domain-containing protein [Alicyclobacillus sp.]
MPDDTTFYRSRPHAPTDLARPMGLCVHSVGWFRCRPDYRVSRTSWYGFHLFYVRGGRGWVVRRGRTWSAEAGDVVALDLSEAHQYFADPWDPWEFLWVHFSGSLAGEYMRLLGADEGPVLRPPKGSRGTGTGAGAGIERRETEDPGTGAGEGAAGPAPEAHLDRWFQRLYDLFEQHTLAEDARAASLLTRILTELLVARLQAGIPPGNPAADPTYPAAVRS